MAKLNNIQYLALKPLIEEYEKEQADKPEKKKKTFKERIKEEYEKAEATRNWRKRKTIQ